MAKLNFIMANEKIDENIDNRFIDKKEKMLVIAEEDLKNKDVTKNIIKQNQQNVTHEISKDILKQKKTSQKELFDSILGD